MRELANEWRKMGWEAIERNLNCEGCGKPHFGDGKWIRAETKTGEAEEMECGSRELCLDWKRLMFRFEYVRAEDVGEEDFEELVRDVEGFWKQYLVVAKGTGCDEQSIFALTYA